MTTAIYWCSFEKFHNFFHIEKLSFVGNFFFPFLTWSNERFMLEIDHHMYVIEEQQDLEAMVGCHDSYFFWP